MNYIIADHMITPLGWGTDATLEAMIEGRTALRLHPDTYPDVDSFCASMIDDKPCVEGCTPFESLCIEVIRHALEEKHLTIANAEETVFILSATKGNVELLASGEDPSLVASARKISSFFANPNAPIVVSNACISGVCALITAMRLLEAGRYKHAVVVGCDVLSTFIVSGFQSLKALSPAPCRPFDAHREGLNLGEAAACVVMTSESRYASLSTGSIIRGAIHNDANHISGPSRTGEGSLRCLEDMEADAARLAFINVHGTATAYNDEMESIALTRAGMQDVPVNSLKGYLGHTLGAAGLVETILSLHAMRQGRVLATKGFEEQGTTQRVDISARMRETDKKEFIKLLSGFGGCNAAIRVSVEETERTDVRPEESLRCVAEVRVSPERVTVNGKVIDTTQRGEALLTELYKQLIGDYPKYYKMDTLSRLGLVATEILLQRTGEDRSGREDRAVVMGNKSSSVKNDTDYQRTIMPGDYFPSPSLFVYTLPNIVTGEIAIRNKYYGESSFYVLDREEELWMMAKTAMMQRSTRSVLAGYVECTGGDNFEAHVKLLTK